MKNLIFISVLFLAFTSSAFANNNPTKSIVLMEEAEVLVTVDKDYRSLFQVAEITKDLASIDFVTHENVDFVQIYNEEGLVEFQLPVDSKKIRINKGFFNSGKYKLGFKVSGESELYIAEVKFK